MHLARELSGPMLEAQRRTVNRVPTCGLRVRKEPMMRKGKSTAIASLALLLAMGVAAPIAAQDSTPAASPQASPAASPQASPGASPEASPVGTGETITSISRDQYYSQLREAFPFEEPASTGGQLIIGESTDIQTTNGILSDDVYSAWINGLIYEAMVGVNPIDGSIVPALADSYEIAADGVTYTFRLNPDAKWHDGTDLTSGDIVFSLDFTLGEGSPYTYQSVVDEQVASYRAIDDDTVEIVTEAPSATFLYDVPGTVVVMPRHVWESVRSPSGRTTRLQRPRPGPRRRHRPLQVPGVAPGRQRDAGPQRRLLGSPSDPGDRRAHLPRPADDNTTVQALTTGEIDLMQDVPPAQLETLQNTEGVEVVVYDTLRFNWYAPNQTLPIFQEREVRQAMLYALDRQLIAEEIYLGLAEQANGTQPVLSPSYAPDQIETVYDYNPDTARQLLEQAGWTDSDQDGTVDKDLNGDGSITDNEQLRFDFIYSEGVAIYEQMVPYMQQAWKKSGSTCCRRRFPSRPSPTASTTATSASPSTASVGRRTAARA
jgi:peptide/nickel transport system substrate-binding protein